MITWKLFRDAVYGNEIAITCGNFCFLLLLTLFSPTPEIEASFIALRCSSILSIGLFRDCIVLNLVAKITPCKWRSFLKPL